MVHHILFPAIKNFLNALFGRFLWYAGDLSKNKLIPHKMES